MAKAIKEIIIFLLVCLVMMLLFAVVLYEYIPNRKVVAEVVKYSASEEVEQQLADNIDEENNEVVLTYEVTSSALDNYETINEYVPRKDNPFAAVSTSDETGSSGNSGSTGNTAKPNNSTTNSTTSNSTTNDNTTSKPTGIK